MYTRILVPLDGSDMAGQVLGQVKILAREIPTRIELFRVVEPVPSESADVLRGIYPYDINMELKRRAADYLEEMSSPLSKSGLSVSCTLGEGDPASQILELAKGQTDTLIAITTHGRSGIARWAFGSVTEKVLQATNSPLFIIRSSNKPIFDSETAIKSMIVPLDGSELAEQVLPHVVYLAKTLDLSVTLLGVTPSAREYYQFMDFPPPPDDDLSEQVDAEALAYLKDQCKKIRSKGVSAVAERLLHGHPADAIVDLSRDLPNNLVAMTTHGRSGIGRWLLGSVANRVVRYCGDPVLLIRVKE